MTHLIIQGPQLNTEQANDLASKINGSATSNGYGFCIKLKNRLTPTSLNELRNQADFDINQLPEKFNPAATKLLISDMDSTLINIECIDEIADYAGKKEEISAITEAAMMGKIDFETSLLKRTKQLAGLNTEVLQQVYQQRLKLNPGAEKLIAHCKHKEINTALVSGGFTFFTQQLHKKLDLDFSLANELQIEHNKLTGNIVSDIVDAKRKADFLTKLATQLDISLNECIAVGDGANDLEMMKIAGLSVAYHAKPKVQKVANTVLNYCGLEGIIGLITLPSN